MVGVEDAAERVRQNVKHLRESRYLSQADLASQLARRGVPGMHPQTIAKIESGTRALKFTEAVQLAAVLEVQLDALAYAGDDAVQLFEMEQAAADVNWALDEAKSALSRLELVLDGLHEHIARAHADGVDVPRWVENVASQTLVSVTGVAGTELSAKLASVQGALAFFISDNAKFLATAPSAFSDIRLPDGGDDGEHQETP